MQDVVVGLESINQSFQPLVDEVNNATLVESRVNEIKQSVSEIVTCIEREQLNQALDVMQTQVVLGIEQLQNELNRIYNEYVLIKVG